MYRINGFKQISAFYSWVFEHQEKVRPHHISLYVFLWNQNNRANWVEYFKCPFDLAITGACIGNRNTYYKTLNELQQWGLIEYQKGINEYKAPIIKLVQLYENDTATDTTTDTPTVTPIDTSIDTSAVHIYNYITNNLKVVTKEWEKIKNFIDELKVKKAEKSATRSQFSKPTIEECFSYCKELGLSTYDYDGNQKSAAQVTAEKFWDYFESNGWKVGGKAAMKDWKSALRNWIRRDREWSKTHQKTKSDTIAEQLIREHEEELKQKKL